MYYSLQNHGYDQDVDVVYKSASSVPGLPYKQNKRRLLERQNYGGGTANLKK